MQLFVLRHRIAEARAPHGTDELRPLSSRGVKATRAAARGLGRFLKSRPDVILTSPRLRAVQTANILGKVLDLRPKIAPELGTASPARILRRLADHTRQTVLIVGHEPTLSQLITLLCAGDVASPILHLKKGGCACLDLDPAGGTLSPRCGTLRWVATPRLLRAVGRN